MKKLYVFYVQKLSCTRNTIFTRKERQLSVSSGELNGLHGREKSKWRKGDWAHRQKITNIASPAK